MPGGETAEAYLERLCREGMARRYPGGRRPSAEERLRFELGVIAEMGFASYFLIVWDYMRWARENGVGVGPGRGSAAGSLVAYALRIVDLDPLAHDLLFERFLNPGRKSMPDIDTDFSVAGRDRVVQYVTEKYGSARWRASAPSASCWPARWCATRAACSATATARWTASPSSSPSGPSASSSPTR